MSSHSKDDALASTAALSQPTILRGVPRLGRALTFRLSPGADAAAALGRVCGALDMRDTTLGIGEPLAMALGRRLLGLATFPGLAGPGCAIPSTQQALWLLLHGEDRGELFDRSRRMQALAAPDLVLDDALDTFNYVGGKDLSGYEDGTENPKDEDAVAAAFVAHGDGLRGGSFVAVQRWVHDLDGFAARTQRERDHTIGRSHADNEELADAPESAHVKRTAQESFDPPAFMLRRSMPWVGAREQGLEFVAYVSALETYERVLLRMIGHEDGIVDSLFSFSRPVTGSYYFCPPLIDGKLDLRCVGL